MVSERCLWITWQHCSTMSRALLLLTNGSMLGPNASTTPDNVSRAQMRKFCSGSRVACGTESERQKEWLDKRQMGFQARKEKLWGLKL